MEKRIDEDALKLLQLLGAEFAFDEHDVGEFDVSPDWQAEMLAAVNDGRRPRVWVN